MSLNKNLVVIASMIGLVILDIFYFNTVIVSGTRERLLRRFQRPDSVNTSEIRVSSYSIEPSSNQTSANSNSSSKYILDTDLCRIPRSDIMPRYYKIRWKVDKIPDCDYERVLGKVNEDDVLELLPENRYSNCSIQKIERTFGNDSTFTLSPPETIEFDVALQDKEMYVVRCNKSFNFEANFPIRVQVQNKMKYWKDRNWPNPDSEPINVLFMGIDTVSRSHAFRSLPKTMSLFKEMGFHDFQGYHSVAPSTLPNFMGLLMGLQNSEVRSNCSSSWTMPFDTCPFIWKTFSANKYVTMYAEDGDQTTFNWGGQSGFAEKPTDFYIHSLFTAMENIRLDNFQFKKTDRLKDLHATCTSNETVPQFLTRYTKRFIRKFRNTPFFSFTWYAYPFHDYNMSLANLDEDLLSLFQYLNGLPSLLNNTLIIFLSDHGERGGFFRSSGVEAYLERSLPPLFIRLPERLLHKYPYMNLNKVMAENAAELTGPFDLHQTLLHLLQLTNLNDSSRSAIQQFKPIRPDRASLFISIKSANTTRDCKTLNISPDACVCNTLLNIVKLENPYYLAKIVDYLQADLRNKVRNSGYSKICAQWTVKPKYVISAQVIAREKDGSSINLIRFGANPGRAMFEAKVRIIENNSKFYGCEIMGDVNRINRYLNQSYCVGSKTDKDKEMKTFCMCKKQMTKS